MDDRPKKKFRIAICGGGIAGLAAAAFLSKSPDIELHIYEAKPRIRAIGAGIAIWKRFWDILHEMLDLNADCTRRGIKFPRWSKIKGPVLRKADIPSGGINFSSVKLGPKIIPRDTFLDILHQNLNTETCVVYTGKKLVAFEDQPSQEVKLSFHDGSSAITDLLIGADGVHSSVRACMFPEDPAVSQPRFSGQFAYRMSFPRKEVELIRPDHVALEGFKIEWCGDGRHVTSNTVGETVQITAYDNRFENGSPLPFDGSWMAEVPSDEISSRYARWEPDLVSLLQVPQVASRWAIHVVHPLPSFVSNRTCLVGDAAHAMTPHLGLGGGQGVEDAYILSRLLSHEVTTHENLSEVLKIYDHVRRPLSQWVAERSLTNGFLYGFMIPEFQTSSLETVGEEMQASCQWLTEGEGYEDEWRRAESILRSLSVADCEH